MSTKTFGKGKLIYKSKGFDAAENKFNAKKKALDSAKKLLKNNG